MSHRAASGQPEGYSVALCNGVADTLKRTLARPSLAVKWVPVSSGFTDLADRRVDLICGADEITPANRARASFSIPIFPGGVSALVRADADTALQDALEERPKPYAPLWRGTPPPTLEHRTYSALVGSATMEALKEHIAKLRLTANVEPVADYDAGIPTVLERQSDVLFGDREKLLQAVRCNPAEKDLRVLTRRFTFALLALATPATTPTFGWPSIARSPRSRPTPRSARCTRTTSAYRIGIRSLSSGTSAYRRAGARRQRARGRQIATTGHCSIRQPVPRLRARNPRHRSGARARRNAIYMTRCLKA